MPDLYDQVNTFLWLRRIQAHFFAFFRADTGGVAQATFGTYYISLVALPVIVAAMGVSYYLGAKKIERQYQRIRENQRRIYGEDK